jgi:hypothetical protein
MESHVTNRCLARAKHTTHEHGVKLERRVSAVRGRSTGTNRGLKASQFKKCYKIVAKRTRFHSKNSSHMRTCSYDVTVGYRRKRMLVASDFCGRISWCLSKLNS